MSASSDRARLHVRIFVPSSSPSFRSLSCVGLVSHRKKRPLTTSWSLRATFPRSLALATACLGEPWQTSIASVLPRIPFFFLAVLCDSVQDGLLSFFLSSIHLFPTSFLLRQNDLSMEETLIL